MLHTYFYERNTKDIDLAILLYTLLLNNTRFASRVLSQSEPDILVKSQFGLS